MVVVHNYCPECSHDFLLLILQCFFFFGEMLMFWCRGHDNHDEGFVIGCLRIQTLNFVLFA